MLYSIVQYSIVQYDTVSVQYSIAFTGIWTKIEDGQNLFYFIWQFVIGENLFHFIWEIFICKTGLNKNSIKGFIIENNTCENMIWLAWERVYFRLKIFLFRNSFLWNVKKEEFVLTEQRKIFNTSERRSYWKPELPSVSLLEVYWKKWSLLKQWRADRLLKILFFIQF